MQTRKTTKGTRTKLSTSVADLGSHKWIDFHNFNAFSYSFITNEVLQLKKTPVTYPIVHSFSSPNFPYSFQVFHNNLVSIELGNNVLADVMINPSHKPFLFSRELFEKPSGTSCAFSLEFASQISELPFNLLDFGRIIKPAVGCDSEIVYSEVNAENFVLQSRVFGINFFGKCEQKKTSVFSVNPQQALIQIPRFKIFSKTIRNAYVKFLSSLDYGNAQDIVLEGSRTGEIISDGSMINDGLGFGFFDNSTCLSNTGNSQLTLKSFFSQRNIDKRMQFDIIPYLSFPSLIDAELQSFSINFNSPYYFRSCFDFNFCGCSALHKEQEEESIYKASHPIDESMGIRSKVTL